MDILSLTGPAGTPYLSRTHSLSEWRHESLTVWNYKYEHTCTYTIHVYDLL